MIFKLMDFKQRDFVHYKDFERRDFKIVGILCKGILYPEDILNEGSLSGGILRLQGF